MLNRVDCNVLLHYFDPLERGVRQAHFARKLLERLIAAFLFQEISQLLSELVAHVGRVRPSVSHIWDK